MIRHCYGITRWPLVFGLVLGDSFLVKNKSQVFYADEKPRVLTCEVSGVPNTYKFNKWRHFINGYLVRVIDGQDDGNLTLPYNNTSDIQYDDSGLYICNVTNNFGNDNGQLWQTGTVNVTIKGKPVKPNVLDYTSSTTWIYVIMEPGSDGGMHQEFIIEYRKQRNKKWKWVLVENDGSSRVSHYISSLDPSTAYEFMLFARNSIGNSSSTETYKVWTKDEKKRFWIGYTIVIIVATVFTVSSITFVWQRRKAKKNLSHRSQITEHSDQGGAIENSLYQSASDLTEPPTASGNVETVNRSIDRRKPNMNRQIVGYNIVGKEESTRTLDCVELKYRDEKNIRYDSSTLNYIEVVFDPVEARSKFHIHGADNRTPYADIDCSLTADPLTSSDEESLSSPDDNNDFMSLEDVQQWNIYES